MELIKTLILLFGAKMENCKKFEDNLIVCKNSIWARNTINEFKEIKFENIKSIRQTKNSLKITHIQWKREFVFEILFENNNNSYKAFQTLKLNIKLDNIVIDLSDEQDEPNIINVFKSWLKYKWREFTAIKGI